MLIVLLVISLAGLICGIVLGVKTSKKSCYDSPSGGSIVLIIVFSFVLIFVISASCFIIHDVLDSKHIDDRIAILEEENLSIENNVSVIVENYKDFENDTLTSLKPEDMIFYISLYPNLSSDSLVQSQIDLYVSNKEEIVELRNKKLDYEISKWWLYFG